MDFILSEATKIIRTLPLSPIYTLESSITFILELLPSKKPKGWQSIYALGLIDCPTDVFIIEADMLKIGRATSMSNRKNRYLQAIRLNQRTEPCPTTARLVEMALAGHKLNIVMQEIERVPSKAAAIEREKHWKYQFHNVLNIPTLTALRNKLKLDVQYDN